MRYKHIIRLFIIIIIISLLGVTVLASDALNLPRAKFSEFDGKKIGVQAGTTQEEQIPKIFKNAEVVFFSTVPDATLALQSGKIDAYFGDDVPLCYAAGNTKDLTVLGTGGDGIDSSIVFQKNEQGDKLKNQFNEFLASYKESGKLEAVTNKWVNEPEDKRVMDTSEIPNVNGVLHIGTEVGYAPFDYIKDGELVGIEVEILRDFCLEYGYQPKYYSTAFDSLIVGVYTGKFDIAANGITITEERSKSVNFADITVTTHGGLLVRKDGGWTGTELAADTDSDTGKGFWSNVIEGFRKTFIDEDRWQMFASGMSTTLVITLASVLFGTILGFVLYLLCRNGNRLANSIVLSTRWLITGMPLVVFLMVLFYIVFANVGINGTAVSVVGFTIVFCFTMFDLLKSGESAVDVEQKEAAYALGYNNLDAFIRIILPQAAVHFMPSYLDEVLSLIKATAVVGYITVLDLTKIGDVIRGRTYDAIYPLLSVVIAYFILSAICKYIIRIFMKKIDTKNRPESKIMKGVEIK